jgi:hypothetical protein
VNGGADWEPIINISEDPAMSIHPDVAVFEDLVCVNWIDTRTSDEEIFIRRSFDAGENWIPPVNITVSMEPDGMAERALTNAVWGNVVSVCWIEIDMTKSPPISEVSLKFSEDRGDNWIIGNWIISYHGDWCTSPAMTAFDGVFHVVWESMSTGGKARINYQGTMDN